MVKLISSLRYLCLAEIAGFWHNQCHQIKGEPVAEKKLSGPASYFPSIEKKYGKPIEFWMKELKKVKDQAHMAQVAHLKNEFKMGHGHANAVVAVFRTDNGL